MDDSIFAGYDGSFQIIFKWSRPSQKEQQAFQSQSKCEFRFVEIQDVMFLLVQLEDLGWQEAPFTPHWYDPKPFQIIPLTDDPNKGYMLTLTLIDSLTNRQLCTRVIGLGHEISRKLYEVTIGNYSKPFDKTQYLQRISSIHARYSPEAIAALCPTGQKYIVGTNPAVPKEKEKTDISAGYDMPDELRRWATIPVDEPTMCIQCIPECLRSEAKGNEKDYIVPVPLKYVLEKGYSISESGFVYIEAKYELPLGLCIPTKYYE